MYTKIVCKACYVTVLGGTRIDKLGKIEISFHPVSIEGERSNVGGDNLVRLQIKMHIECEFYVVHLECEG